MTVLPTLPENNIDYVLETAQYVQKNTGNRRAGEKGEEEAKEIFLDELKKYCDETKEQRFSAYPGSGTNIHRALSVILFICTILFCGSVSSGAAVPVAISLFFNLLIFVLFSHKFLFDGTKLDIFSKRKRSANISGTRYAKGMREMRVVLTSNMDSPIALRGFLFGNRATFILSLVSVVGNTFLFICQLLFLFSGAPIGSAFFGVLSVINIAFLPFYFASLVVVDSKKSTSGVSSSLLPSSILLSVAKQLHEQVFRYDNTEVVFLITGSEYSGRAGAYAFAKRHRKLYSDVPTIFISLEEITSSDNLSVFFKDGSGTTGSRTVASVIAQAAENLNLSVSKESGMLGTSTFTPFAKQGFESCALGTSKKHISRSVSANADKLSSVRRKTVSDIASLILETLNYYNY